MRCIQWTYPINVVRDPFPVAAFLQTGAIGLGGLRLADLLRLRAQASPTGSSDPDTSIILVWLPGGPLQMETYDMKPDAPAEYRGEFRPIRTNVPGIDICELLPLHTKIADRFRLIRSISHDFADHGGGQKRVLTGRLLIELRKMSRKKRYIAIHPKYPKLPCDHEDRCAHAPIFVAFVRTQPDRGGKCSSMRQIKNLQ